MHKLLSCGLVILLAGGGAFGASSAKAAEPNWPQGAFKYMILDQDIRDALIELGRHLGVEVKISEQVSGHRIRSKLSEGDAQQFLKSLCDSYGIVWFFDGAVMYFSAADEVKTENVDLGSVRTDELNKKLRELGTADGRHLIRAVSERQALVSGSPSYISFVRRTVAAMSKSSRENSPVRVIRAGQEGT